MKKDFINKIANECVEDWNYYGGELYFEDEEDLLEYIYCNIKYNGVYIDADKKLSQMLENNISEIYDIMQTEIESQIDYAAGIQAAKDAYYSDLI